jgi:hypothetical protein
VIVMFDPDMMLGDDERERPVPGSRGAHRAMSEPVE